MANISETAEWTEGVYQLETTDPVEGGPEGVDNLQAKQLANRTKYLKALVEGLAEGKQPLDATLTALAAIATAANQLIYATGSNTFATTALTAFARTLLDDADAATARATLGLGAAALLAVGTAAGTVAAGDHAHPGVYQPAGSYQAADATLTALAAMATAANQLIYATGSNTFATTALTAFARTLLDDADAATARATLGAQATLVANDPGVKTALNASGSAPIFACRAWVNFNGTGTVAIRASGNVSSVTDNGAADYTVNFITAMPDVDYCPIITGSSGPSGCYTGPSAITDNLSSFRFRTVNKNIGISDAPNFGDWNYVYLSIFR